MEKTDKYLQAESVVIQPKKYDHRDVYKAQYYLDAYKDGYNKALSLSDVGQRFLQLPEDYKRYAELSFKYRQEGCNEDEDQEHWDLKVKLGGL